MVVFVMFMLLLCIRHREEMSVRVYLRGGRSRSVAPKTHAQMIPKISDRGTYASTYLTYPHIRYNIDADIRYNICKIHIHLCIYIDISNISTICRRYIDDIHIDISNISTADEAGVDPKRAAPKRCSA